MPLSSCFKTKNMSHTPFDAGLNSFTAKEMGGVFFAFLGLPVFFTLLKFKYNPNEYIQSGHEDFNPVFSLN